MALLVTFNGSQYLIPTTGEENWGSTVTNYLADLAGSALTLTATATISNKVLHLQSGTAAAPSLSFTADTGSGLYMPVIGQVGLATAGVQRLLVNAAGLVSIGNVALTAGTIDGVQIGSITPSTAVFSSVLVEGASQGQVQLSPGNTTNTGYTAFFNSAGVRQGYIGFGNTNGRLNLAVDGAPGTTTGWNLSGTLSLASSLYANTIFMPNNTAIVMNDAGGTAHPVLYIGPENATNIFNAGAGRIRFLNQAGSAELIGSDNAGNVSIPNKLTVSGDVHANVLYTANHVRNTASGALWLEGGAGGYPGAATFIVNDGSRPNYAYEWYWGGAQIATLNTAGELTTAGNITATGNLVADGGVFISNNTTNGSFFLYNDGSNKYLNFQADGWKLLWGATGGAAGWLVYYNYTGTGLFWVTNTGDVHVAGNVNAANVSDDRVKHQVAPYTRGLADLIQLAPISYQYNGLGGTTADGKLRHGLSAQHSQAFIPECVVPTPVPPVDPTKDGLVQGAHLLDDQLSLDPAPLTFALINAVKELNARVVALEAALAAK